MTDTITLPRAVIEQAISAIDRSAVFQHEYQILRDKILIELRAALAQQAAPTTTDKAWSQFCGGIGRGPNAPYPGMIEAFETHYSQSFVDKDWRNETGVWAAAWGHATRQSIAQQAEQGWQPIETAPKNEASFGRVADDNPKVLLLLNTGIHCVAYWDGFHSKKHGRDGFCWVDGITGNVLEPEYGTAIHWMPLPTAPKGGV